jgi:hypothetical protein
MKVRNRYFIIMAIAWGPCLLAAAASYAVILRPQLDHKKELEANVAHCKQRYARAFEAAKEKDQSLLAGEVESLQKRLGSFVVSATDAPGLSFKVGELANETKLVSFGMRPANRNGPDPLANLEQITEKHMDLSFGAGFRRFAAFLNALERHRPVLFVETFAINRPAEKNAEPQANMELAVLVEKAAGPVGVSK